MFIRMTMKWTVFRLPPSLFFIPKFEVSETVIPETRPPILNKKKEEKLRSVRAPLEIYPNAASLSNCDSYTTRQIKIQSNSLLKKFKNWKFNGNRPN